MIINEAANNTLVNRSKDVAYNLIEGMERTTNRGEATVNSLLKTLKKGGLYEVSPFDHMNAKVHVLYQKIENLSINSCNPYNPCYSRSSFM